MPDRDPSPLALALGRIPTGLYIVSTLREGRPLGFVGSFVVQTGFEPPTVCVAVGRDREHLGAMREAGVFALSILDRESQGSMAPFFKPWGPGESPFDAVETQVCENGCAVLSGSLAWVACRLSGEYDGGGDHVVVFGEVTSAEKLRDGEPSVHLRRNGLSY